MIWLMIGYMYLFIHRPFEIWPIIGDIRLELIYMLITGAYWLVGPEKQFKLNPLNLAFMSFASVIFLACAASAFSEQSLIFFTDYYWKLLIFYLLLVTVIRDEKDLKRVIVSLVCIIAIYLLHSLREFYAGKFVFRMGIARMVGVGFSNNDPNSFAGTIVLTLVFVPLLWRSYPNRTAHILLGAFTALAFTCIALTGSRGAFLALLLWAGIAIMQSKHRGRLAVLAVTVSPLLWFLLPESLQQRFETILWPEVGPANARASSEGRTEGLLIGLQLWQNNPLFGIGPGVWRLATHREIESHNLYGQLVGETGTMGLLAFLGILAAYTANILTIRRAYRETPGLQPDFLYHLSSSIGVSVVLLLFAGTYGHNLFRYHWLWYAGFLVAARQCLQTKIAALPEEPPDHPDELATEVEWEEEPVGV